MNTGEYLNCLARCPKCNTRLWGKIKVTSIGDAIDVVCLKKISPECICTKCGQLFETRSHLRSRALLSLLISVIIMIPTVPVAFYLGYLIHVSLGIILAFLTMWAGLTLPALLMPGYKPKDINNPNKSTHSITGSAGSE